MFQTITRDKSIPIESKAVYAYLSSFAGKEDECYPSVSLMCDELGITKSTLYKYMDFLVKAGIVEKRQTYRGNLKDKVIYRITHEIKSNLSVSENLGIRKNGNPEVSETKNNILKNNNIDYQLVADMYNEICISFPKLTKLSDKRKKTIKARFNSGYTLNDFEKLFELAENSSFLKGANNRNWSATFDWLIADANMAKVLDHNYENKISEVNQDVQSESSIKLW